MTMTEHTTPNAPAIDALGNAVSRVTAAAALAQAVADYVPHDAGKCDCLDAIEMHLLRPAAAELQEAYGAVCGVLTRS
jgi:hypothetical protein